MGKGGMMAFVFEDEQQAPKSGRFVFEDEQSTPATEMQEAGTVGRSLVGYASPMVETYYGAKQLLKGGLEPDEQANLKAWQQMGEEAPFLSKLAGTVAPMMVGGAGLARTGIKGLATVGQAMSAPQTVAQAAGAGAALMGLQPVEGDGVGLVERAGNAALGAGAGAASQKLAMYIGGKLADKYGARVMPKNIDDEIVRVLRETGQRIDDLPNGYIDDLRAQVADSLARGQKLDIASAARMKDFQAAGISPTSGQVTRDPMQYAAERNLRGVAGIGEPLSARFSQQENILRGKIGGYAEGAADRYAAGSTIGDTLTKADESMSANVRSLYKAARESTGKDLDVPIQGLAQDYATVLRDFGDKIPSGVRNNFEDLGLLTGKQLKNFTVEEADRLLKVINSNTSADPATNRALTMLRGSVKNAVDSLGDEAGVFKPAVEAAAKRFRMHDMLPALKDAAAGKLDADKFVARHIVGAKPEAVKSLSNMLKTTDPIAFNQARAQVGEYLRRAGYGLQETGDTAFRPAGFANAMDKLGERLNAFYSPQEIADLRNLSKVGSYMFNTPAQSAVSTSNSGVPVVNSLLGLAAQKIPFGNMIIEGSRNAAKSAAQRKSVEEALKAVPKNIPLAVDPAVIKSAQNALARLMTPAAISMPMAIE